MTMMSRGSVVGTRYQSVFAMKRFSVQDRDRSEDRTPRDRKSKDRVSHVIFEVTTEYLFKTDRYAKEKNELLLYNS